MKTNITYIISNINKALAFEWIAQQLNKEEFNLNFILLNSGDSELETYLIQHNIKVDRIVYRNKFDIPRAIFNTCKILSKNKTKIVHTHLFDANIVGLTAALLVGIKKRIHTRHHSDYHHCYYPKAVKYDKYVNLISTKIVAISNVVKDILITNENTPEKKIRLIHHGFELADFANPSILEKNKLEQKYNPNHGRPVIGVISRYIEWKGIQYIIPAFQNILSEYPNALLILANANGNYKTEVRKMLQSIPENNYLEIPFESDVFTLYNLFDIFVHVPISPDSEAFGQTYVESLAAGLPSIFTLSGIANEFIQNRQNALVVSYKSSDEIYKALIELLKNKELGSYIGKKGQADVNKMFGLDKMILSLENIYKE